MSELEKLREEYHSKVREMTERRKAAREMVVSMYATERRKANMWLAENGYPENTISELSVGKKVLNDLKANHPEYAEFYTSAVSVTNVGKANMGERE